MAKVKYDVTGVDHKKAREVSNFESPIPGVYKAKISDMTPGYSKGADSKPDKKKPRIEVIFEILDKGDYKGAKVWYYLTFGEGFPKQKFDQFLQAFGVNTSKKSKGELDTDDFIGETCKIRVKKGTNQQGDYKAEIGDVFSSDSPDEDDDDDDLTDDDDDDTTDDDDDDAGDDDDDDGDDGDEDDGYDDMSVAELRKMLKKRGKESSGAKPALIARLRETEADDDDDDDDGDDPF